jgi:hypothetical protein
MAFSFECFTEKMKIIKALKVAKTIDEAHDAVRNVSVEITDNSDNTYYIEILTVMFATRERVGYDPEHK